MPSVSTRPDAPGARSMGARSTGSRTFLHQALRSALHRTLRTLALVAVALATAPFAHAQAVPPDVSAEQPLPTVSTGLGAMRFLPGVVALVHRPSSLPPDQDRSPYEPIPVRVKNAVRSWEYLLLGLGIPYRVIDDAELAAGIDRGVRILVLPGSEMMTDRQRASVARYVEGGGGLIAQGRTGLFDDRAAPRPASERFFADLFGAEYVTGLPEQPGGIFQQLDGSHMPTAGIAPGYLVNLTAQTPTTAARAVTSQSLGKLVPYNATDNAAFAPVTMALYGETGRGRVVWTRFLPQDVSRETEQQQNYVTLLINSLAYVTRSPVTAVRPWPEARLSAYTVALTPLVGGRREFRPSLERLLDAMAPAGLRPAIFFTGDEAKVFPELVERAGREGELGVASVTDDALKYAPLEDQMRRVKEAVALMARFGPTVGFHPPAGYFDHNTIRAMEDAGLRYLLRFLPHPSMAPSALMLAEDADFRETIYGNLIDVDTLRVIEEVGIAAPNAPGIPSTALRTNDTREQVDAPSDGPTVVEARREQDRIAARYERYAERQDSIYRAQTRRTTGLTAAERRIAEGRRAAIEQNAASGDLLTDDDLGRNRLSARYRGTATSTTGTSGTGVRTIRAGESYAVNDTVLVTNRRYQTQVRNTDTRPTVTRPQMRAVSESVGLYERNDSSYAPRLDLGTILAVGIWGRDDYEVTAGNIERSSDPAAQLAEFRTDFLDVHDARGLYILNLHAEIQGLTAERARVPVDLAEVARQEGAWVTTLGAVNAWWRQRGQTVVSLTNLTADGGDLLVVNNSGAVIDGLSLDLFLNGAVRGRRVSLSTTAARFVTPESDDRLTLVFPTLAPGATRMRLTFTRDTATSSR